ncbi:hypothetical protein [Flagellimonas sp. CMM7]|uniref:hypothetical protein n=1 Tax=Flagellimonas sp. CMM7 TaxID=2654676 RepID=UPI0013D22C4C|nr:hypothetical protein [Flagellimonas sp. CMM7]UII78581.1 hypothetical protein LV704_13005 [Flagellimonas sp. CMM7]
MILVTCQNPDCSTPHFYVDIRSGKFPLLLAPKTPELAVAENAATINSDINRILKSSDFGEGMEKLDEPERERINQIISRSNISRLFSKLYKKQFEEKLEVKDYLLVFCESGHRNYIPLTEDKEIYLENIKKNE